MWYVFASTALAACSAPAPPVGTIGHITTYFGGAASEEPRAALIARDVLSAGGSAADAAVAMYFAMAVTLPSAAGLGGGGVCVYYDSRTNKAEALDFIARAPDSPSPDGRWPATAPGSVRGMFALHARYGRLTWEQLIQPAESMARFGIPAPRALVRALPASPVLDDPLSRRQFGGSDGGGLKETDTLQRVDLAATLGRLRSAPGDLYTGVLARAYVEGISAIGGWITIDDLRAQRPVWRETIVGSFGSHRVHFAPSPVTGGQVAAALWAKFGDNASFSGMDLGARERMLVEAAREAYSGATTGPRPTGASAGFLAMDREGSTAACTVTMNRPFGTGRTIPGLGILAVQPPQDAATAYLSLAPMMIVNHNTSTSYLAATGAGDPFAPVALMTAALHATGGKIPVARALAAPRAAPGPRPGAALIERNAPPDVKAAFASAAATETDGIGRTLMMYCPDGMTVGWRDCAVAVDPRGYGYAVNAER